MTCDCFSAKHGDKGATGTCGVKGECRHVKELEEENRRIRTQRDMLMQENSDLLDTHRWIPVEEKLTVDGAPVLVATKNGYILFLQYDAGREIWHCLGREYSENEIGYWMRIPTPPEVKK